jgi:hypothetical protein
MIYATYRKNSSIPVRKIDLITAEAKAIEANKTKTERILFSDVSVQLEIAVSSWLT